MGSLMRSFEPKFKNRIEANQRFSNNVDGPWRDAGKIACKNRFQFLSQVNSLLTSRDHDQ